MNLDSTKNALYTWMKRETGWEIIFANQSEQRPKLPSGTINFVNPGIRVGGIDELRMKGRQMSVAGLRTALCSLNLFGKGANQKMSELLNTLDRPDVIDEFRAAGLAHIGENGPNDLTALMETKYQERSQLDLTLQYAIENDANVGTIESVEIENTNFDEVTVIETENEEA